MPHWITSPLRNYGTFTGRARRKEFLGFALVFLVLTVGAHYVDASLDQPKLFGSYMGIVELTIFLLLILPFIAVSARRLHDCGRSAWWLLFLYLPYLGFRAAIGNEQATIAAAAAFIFGAFMLFVQLIIKGDAGENRFGPDPRIAPPA